MKKAIRFLLFIASFAACLNISASCGNSSDEEPQGPATAATVEVSPEALTTEYQATTIELFVKANVDWAVKCDADWVTIRPSGGLKDIPSTVQVSVKANDTMDGRTASINIISAGKILKSVTLTQGFVEKASASTTSIITGARESTESITITANSQWQLSADADWLSVSPSSGEKGSTQVAVKIDANELSETRNATLSLTCGQSVSEIKVSQMSDEIVVPEGYSLVWHDEFNEGTVPSSEWVLENWPAGYVNNELQIYTSKPVDGKYTAEIKDGILNINCFKASDGKIYSARMNALPSKGWLYGYFEARILLPSGKGTWPAFWMMPCNVDWNTNPWPKCGEIDIMEEVGANPDYVSSSLHTMNYNHTKGTQITHEMKCPGAEGSFHIYALEWTEDEIITYVDGKVQLRALRSSMGTDHDSWPFHYAFYPILNLAWGGDWGGYKGVDDNALPVTMKVDYVRIFQKK